jgi:hypothetical protein
MTYQKVHNRNGGTRRKLFSHGVSGRPCLDSLVHLKKKEQRKSISSHNKSNKIHVLAM